VNAEPPAGPPWDLPLDEAPFAFVDLEMTGLDPENDRVCEACVVRTRGERVERTVETLVRPDVPMGRGVLVHGIGDDLLAAAPPFADVAGALCEALDGAILVAHAAEHDVAFLTAELGRAGRTLPIVGVLDTLPLARRCFSRTSHRLGALCESLGISLPNAHRAGDDARATMALFFKIAAVLAAAAPRDLWHVRIGERHARPEIVERAILAVEAAAPVAVRYRPSKRAPLELVMVLTDVRTDVDPPRIHGYDAKGRSRRELRADRVLAIEPYRRP
jgi:DNA polymerase-3 subunit epsilon